MPFNGSGTFNRIYSWVTDAANSIDVSSSRTDTDSNDIAAGLSNCICRDGQTTLTANIPMSSFKLTGLGAGSATTDSVNLSQLIGYASIEVCEYRLSLTTAVPVTTSDVVGATLIRLVPYKGNRIALYDGTNWHVRTGVETFSAVPGGSLGAFDVFCFDSAGTPTLECLAWTNSTTRATGLTTQDGVLVKSGDATRRYLGSAITNISGQLEDSFARRFVWNYYNRVRRPMLVQISATYNYTTNTFRQWGGSTANQLDFMVGWSEDPVIAVARTNVSNSGATVAGAIGIGLDSSTTNNASTIGGDFITPATAAELSPNIVTSLEIFPGVGRHTLVPLEKSSASGTTSWAYTLASKCGISGSILG